MKKQIRKTTKIPTLHQQKGATLAIALVLLLMFTAMVTGTFSLTSTNTTAVSNMQIREEAIASANAVIEQIIGSNFTATPAAQDLTIDINNDSTTDYTVSVAEPVCLRALQASTASLSSASLSAMSSQGSWNTLWEITATVNDVVTGASATVRSGVRVLLSQSEKNAVCP